MTPETVWIIRDDFDQATVAVVKANSEADALLWADDFFEATGDLYAVEKDLFDITVDAEVSTNA